MVSDSLEYYKTNRKINTKREENIVITEKVTNLSIATLAPASYAERKKVARKRFSEA